MMKLLSQPGKLSGWGLSSICCHSCTFLSTSEERQRQAIQCRKNRSNLPLLLPSNQTKTPAPKHTSRGGFPSETCPKPFSLPKSCFLKLTGQDFLHHYLYISQFSFQSCVFKRKIKSPTVHEGQRSLLCAELSVLPKLTMSHMTLTGITVIWIQLSCSAFFVLSSDSTPLLGVQKSCYSYTSRLAFQQGHRVVRSTSLGVQTPVGFISAQH